MRAVDGNHVHPRDHLVEGFPPCRLKRLFHLGAEAAAVEATRRIAEAAEYVGVIAVEMFVVRKDETEELVINEIAPRVHNSGHWTLDGSETSQFEQHMRAVAGWPLGSTQRHGVSVTMRNLIGHDADRWPQLLSEDGACLHLYGKKETRDGRKMGHVTRIQR